MLGEKKNTTKYIKKSKMLFVTKTEKIKQEKFIEYSYLAHKAILQSCLLNARFANAIQKPGVTV